MISIYFKDKPDNEETQDNLEHLETEAFLVHPVSQDQVDNLVETDSPEATVCGPTVYRLI